MGMSISVEAATQGKEVVWGAPVYDQVYTSWEETKRACPPNLKIIDYKESRMTATHLRSGGRILFRSLEDPDNARSKTADVIVVDEAAKVAEAAWKQVLRPMLMDTAGEAWFLFTPQGRNWVWRESARAREKPNSAFFQAPTLGAEIVGGKLIRKPHPLENPDIPFEELLDIFETMTEREFRQEILAEFIENEGAVFRNVIESIDSGRKKNEEPKEGEFYSVGGDLARIEDYTVIPIFDSSGRQVFHDRFSQISWERQIGTLIWVCKKYPGRLYLDSTGVGDPIYERLRDAGLSVVDFKFTNASKRGLIDNLALGLEKGAIRLMDIPAQTDELLSYEYEKLPSGTIRTNAPSGTHDDCVIGLALAYWGVSRKPPGPAYAGPPMVYPSGLPPLH